MTNANRKGRDAENRLRDWFSVNGYDVELLRLQGVHDPGDLWLPHENARIEVKNHRQVLTAINEAIHDVEKLDVRFPLSKNFAVVARPGQSPGDWYVVRRVGATWPPQVGSPAYMFGESDDVARPT